VPGDKAVFEPRLVVDALRAATEGTDTLVLYKHSADALAGRGDADCYIAPFEVDHALDALRRFCETRGLELWLWRYRPWALTTYLVEPGPSSRLVAEIDLNSAPTVALLQWFHQSAVQDARFLDQHGLRVADVTGEALASLLYWHLSQPLRALPRREIAAVARLDDDEVRQLRSRTRRYLDQPAAAAMLWWTSKHLLCVTDAPVDGFTTEAMRKLVRLVFFVTSCCRTPCHVLRGITWHLTHRRARRFYKLFTHQARRSIDALGGYSQFAELLTQAGGILLHRPQAPAPPRGEDRSQSREEERRLS
jgi:hypothetical protein